MVLACQVSAQPFYDQAPFPTDLYGNGRPVCLENGPGSVLSQAEPGIRTDLLTQGPTNIADLTAVKIGH